MTNKISSQILANEAKILLFKKYALNIDSKLNLIKFDRVIKGFLRVLSVQVSSAPLYQKVQSGVHLFLQFVVVLHFGLDPLQKGLVQAKLLQQLKHQAQFDQNISHPLVRPGRLHASLLPF